jgi:glucose-1-phosphate thymidylyltransferase
VSLGEVDPNAIANFSELAGRTLLLNARLVPSQSQLTRIRELLKESRSILLTANNHIVAAWVDNANRLLNQPVDEWLKILRSQSPAMIEQPVTDWQLFEHPHDLVRFHQASVAENLSVRIEGNYRQLADGVFVGPNVTLGAHLVSDTSKGPIVIERDSVLGPFCHLRGPVYIGAGARINEHASLKDGTCLGHTTKVGGEVECSMLEPYSNKQHHGFLGHSYVGSWVNLGAGTSNSDLKNTYGTVNINYRGKKVNTGMQFIGCMIGDYSKTAINTSIFTGKVIGACSMVYGFVTGNVPSFVNYARSFGQVTEAPVDVMIATQARMFARRNKVQRPCDIQLLRDMYELTRSERLDFGEALSTEPLSW